MQTLTEQVLWDEDDNPYLADPNDNNDDENYQQLQALVRVLDRLCDHVEYTKQQQQQQLQQQQQEEEDPQRQETTAAPIQHPYLPRWNRLELNLVLMAWLQHFSPQYAVAAHSNSTTNSCDQPLDLTVPSMLARVERYGPHLFGPVWHNKDKDGNNKNDKDNADQEQEDQDQRIRPLVLLLQGWHRQALEFDLPWRKTSSNNSNTISRQSTVGEQATALYEYWYTQHQHNATLWTNPRHSIVVLEQLIQVWSASLESSKNIKNSSSPPPHVVLDRMDEYWKQIQYRQQQDFQAVVETVNSNHTSPTFVPRLAPPNAALYATLIQAHGRAAAAMDGSVDNEQQQQYWTRMVDLYDEMTWTCPSQDWTQESCLIPVCRALQALAALPSAAPQQSTAMAARHKLVSLVRDEWGPHLVPSSLPNQETTTDTTTTTTTTTTDPQALPKPTATLCHIVLSALCHPVRTTPTTSSSKDHPNNNNNDTSSSHMTPLEWLQQMQTWAEVTGDDSFRPDLACYTTVVWSLVRAGQYEQAESLVHDMMETNLVARKSTAVVPQRNNNHKNYFSWQEDRPFSLWKEMVDEWSDKSSTNHRSALLYMTELLQRLVQPQDTVPNKTKKKKKQSSSVSSLLSTTQTWNPLLAAHVRHHQQQHTLHRGPAAAAAKRLDHTTANHAQALYDWMQHQTNEQHQPDSTSLLLLLQAWAHAGNPSQADHVLREAATSLSNTVTLNAQHFQVVWQAYAQESKHDPEASIQAMALLEFMEEQQDESLKPTLENYTSLFWTLARSSSKHDPAPAMELLWDKLMHQWRPIDDDDNSMDDDEEEEEEANELDDSTTTSIRDVEAEQEEPVDESVHPTAETFHAVLSGWTKSREWSSMLLAVELFEAMEQAPYNVRRNSQLYHTLMTAWMRRNHPQKVQDLFDEWQTRRSNGELADQEYNKQSLQPPPVRPSWMWSTRLQAWAKAGYPEETFQVLKEWLHVANESTKQDKNKIVDEHEDSSSSSLSVTTAKAPTVDRMPRTREFNAVLQAWLRSDRPEAAEKAELLLQTMTEWSQAGTYRCTPDWQSYSTVIATHAKSNAPESGRQALSWLFKLQGMTQEQETVQPQNQHPHNDKDTSTGSTRRQLSRKKRAGASTIPAPDFVMYAQVLAALIRSRNKRASANAMSNLDDETEAGDEEWYMHHLLKEMQTQQQPKGDSPTYDSSTRHDDSNGAEFVRRDGGGGGRRPVSLSQTKNLLLRVRQELLASSFVTRDHLLAELDLVEHRTMMVRNNGRP